MKYSLYLLIILTAAYGCKSSNATENYEREGLELEAVVQNTTASDSTYDLSISIPVLKASDTVLSGAFNRFVDSVVQFEKLRFTRIAHDANLDMKSQYEMTHEVLQLDEKAISVVLYTEQYLAGDAFPRVHTTRILLNSMNARRLTLSDFFVDEIPFDVLTAFFNNYIITEFGPQCMLNASNAPALNNSFDIKRDTLVLYHPYGKLKACSGIVYDIPFASIDSLLKPEWQVAPPVL